MTDMLVNLYRNTPESGPVSIDGGSVHIHRAMAADTATICQFVADHFEAAAGGWVGECKAALAQVPSTCFIAVHRGSVIGFCCYDSTARGMLGPLGVAEDYQHRGVAQALLSYTLQAMKAAGYAYAVIGWVHSEAFYEKACGAITIPDSTPGIYSRLIGAQTNR